MEPPVKFTGDRRIRFGSVITTYRCNAKCNMCDIWKSPTKPLLEIDAGVYEKLPKMDFINVTGGEPFLRTDLDEIVSVLTAKATRVVISSNGWFVDRTLKLFEKYGNRIGIRISIEGLSQANDSIRGMSKGFDHAIRILTTLDQMGIKDIGFGLTVQDVNAKDLNELYQLARMMKVEFATAAVHNSFYFHKNSNRVDTVTGPVEALRNLAANQLRERHPKSWFRAYFNYGLINYLHGQSRLLPCRMGHDAFFLQPEGDVVPCNGMVAPMRLGNLREQTWEEIWCSESAECARTSVRECERQCWMMGSVAQEMKRHILTPAKWVLKHKFLGNSIEIPPLNDFHPHSLYGVDELTAAETMKLYKIQTASPSDLSTG